MKFNLNRSKKFSKLSVNFKINIIWIILQLAIVAGSCNTAAAAINDPNIVGSSDKDPMVNDDIVTNHAAEEQLSKIIKNLRFINAQFSQTVSNSSGLILQEQHGVIKLKKPNLLNWEVITPDRLIIVMDGEKMWHYDLDLEQIIVTKISKQVQANPISKLLLNDLSDNLTEFKINYWRDDPTCNLGFILVPQDPEKVVGFIKCYLGFNRNEQLILIKLIDQLDQEITFNFLKFKPKIDPAAFRFKVPSGVDVIEED